MKIAHIISPVKVNNDRDLFFQQPITFETMRIAQEFAAKFGIEVDLFATVFGEDEEIIPGWFKKTANLNKSTLGKFKIQRKLPYFKDILDNLYDYAEDADYMIQTNADIGLQPHFYTAVKALIDTGNDSFCINKRIIPDHFKHIRDLPVLWSIIGNEHAGHDCFVFRRELYPKFDIGEICMGTPWSETTLITNMVAYADDFSVFKYAHLTFHIGDRRIWLVPEYNDYRIHNTNEFARILKQLSDDNKKILDHSTIQYLLKKLKIEVEGYKNEVYSDICKYFVKVRP